MAPGHIGADGSVDLSSIPLAVIDRVESLKNNATAVYGSGALGGVVNINTRRHFSGAEGVLYVGSSQRADAFTYDLSAVAGHSSDDHNANVMVSAGLQSQRPVLADDRAFASPRTPTIVLIGPGVETAHNLIDASNIDVNGDGKGDQVNVCGDGVRFCTSNGAGGYRPYDPQIDRSDDQRFDYLYTPSSRHSLYGAGSYRLRPEVLAFVQASYLNRTSSQQIAPESFSALPTGIPISKNSLSNMFGGDVLGYDRRLDEFGPRRSSQNIDTVQITGGIQGSIPDDTGSLKNWKWELSYSYGRSNGSEQRTGSFRRSRLAAALGPSFLSANGVPTCGTPAAPIAGCVPMNILGPAGSIDPAARDYAAFTGVAHGFHERQSVLATIQGRIAELSNGGHVSGSVGTEFRHESGGFTPDPLTTAGDTTSFAQGPIRRSFTAFEGSPRCRSCRSTTGGSAGASSSTLPRAALATARSATPSYGRPAACSVRSTASRSEARTRARFARPRSTSCTSAGELASWRTARRRRARYPVRTRISTPKPHGSSPPVSCSSRRS